MKWFSDDYDTDETEKKMKVVKGSVQRGELLHIHSSIGWRPSLDLYETEEHLIVLMDVAGM